MESVGVRKLVPLLGIRDMTASLAFYRDGLGFELGPTWVVEGRIRWCWLELGGAAIMLQEYLPDFQPKETLGTGVGLNFMCDDALAFYKEARRRGITTKRPFVGNRMWVTSLSDPDGYDLHFESPTDAPEESEYQD